MDSLSLAYCFIKQSEEKYLLFQLENNCSSLMNQYCSKVPRSNVISSAIKPIYIYTGNGRVRVYTFCM